LQSVNNYATYFQNVFRVTWADTDSAQIVHYSNYFRFFERAEEEFYRYLGFNFIDIGGKGLWLPRVEAFCRYKKPARFNDFIEVELTVKELGEKSVKYGFKIFNKESAALLADGLRGNRHSRQANTESNTNPKGNCWKVETFLQISF